MARILITGGASGLGAALVARFAARGDRVLVTDLAETCEVPEGAVYQRLDVTSGADWLAARELVRDIWDGLDILINNAGVAAGGRIDLVSGEEWARVMDINVLGVATGCATFTPMFKAAGSGHLVNTASLAGLVHPPGMASYSAAKAAVVALSESLRYELAPHGIDVSVVCPSFFRTNLSASLHDDDPQMSAAARKLIDRAPRDADQVAVAVVAGIDARRFLILPDPAARKAFWMKRLARPLYDRTMFGMGRRTAALTE